MKSIAQIRATAAEMIRASGFVLSDADWEELSANDFGLGRLEIEGFVFVDLLRTPKLRVTLFVLLPEQTLPEHYHPIEAGAKEESIRVLNGQTRVYVPGAANDPQIRIPSGKDHWYTVRHRISLASGESYTIEAPVVHWFQGGRDGSVNITIQNRVDESLNVFTDPASTGCPIKLSD